tara:strand:+ start:430 stop:741 length:312 start_codon:yes stop_codon:yes gene_type:complete
MKNQQLESVLNRFKFDIAEQRIKAKVRKQFNSKEHKMYKELNKSVDTDDLATTETKLSTTHKELVTREKMLLYNNFERTLDQLGKKLDNVIIQILKTELNECD